MGHIRLGVLPTSKKWRDVVGLLNTDAHADEIAAAAGLAAEGALKNAADDPILSEAAWMMTMLPLVARSYDFERDLAELNLQTEDLSDLFSLSAALSRQLDARALKSGGRTDLGEMAQAALVESLVDAIEPQLPSLFEPEPREVRKALGRLSSGDRFAALARDFFSRLSHRALDYYLSRELANHVGAGRRFGTDQDRRVFDDAVARHCREASQIVEKFAGGWYGKNVWRNGSVNRETVRGFTSYAFTKLRGELKRRRDAA